MKRKLLIVVFSVLFFSACTITTSRGGQEIGYVVDAEEHGWLFHNFYIQVKNSDQQSAREEYCIPNENRELFDKAQEFVTNQKKVVVKYHKVNNFFTIGKCDGYIADNITEVK